MSKNTLDETPHSEIVSETITALLVSGGNITEAAESLDVHRSTIYDRMDKHPEIRRTIELISAEAVDRLKIASVKAAQVLVDSLDDPELRFKAAIEILDRVGVKVDGQGATPALPVPILTQIKRMEEENWKEDFVIMNSEGKRVN